VTISEKDMAVATGSENSIVKRMLNSMWGYWMFLLAISFGVAAIIYWVWLRGTV
jgi:hypothetical protein